MKTTEAKATALAIATLRHKGRSCLPGVSPTVIDRLLLAGLIHDGGSGYELTEKASLLIGEQREVRRLGGEWAFE